MALEQKPEKTFFLSNIEKKVGFWCIYYFSEIRQGTVKLLEIYEYNKNKYSLNLRKNTT